MSTQGNIKQHKATIGDNRRHKAILGDIRRYYATLGEAVTQSRPLKGKSCHRTQPEISNEYVIRFQCMKNIFYLYLFLFEVRWLKDKPQTRHKTLSKSYFIGLWRSLNDRQLFRDSQSPLGCKQTYILLILE